MRLASFVLSALEVKSFVHDMKHRSTRDEYMRMKSCIYHERGHGRVNREQTPERPQTDATPTCRRSISRCICAASGPLNCEKSIVVCI